jgi:hypothetical protein
MRSVSLSGGKTDGVSGPGVGSVIISVHDGGVGMMIFGVVVGVITGAAAGEAQADTRKERKRQDENFRMLDSVCGFLTHAI